MFVDLSLDIVVVDCVVERVRSQCQIEGNTIRMVAEDTINWCRSRSWDT